MSTELTSDEKLMAGLSWWGSIILWCAGIGFVAPLVIYLVKKDSSAFVKKQSFQALVFNLFMIVLGIVMSVLAGTIGLITFGLGFFLVVPIMILAGVALTIYMIVLGYQVYQGQDVRIPFMTDFIEKNLSQF